MTAPLPRSNSAAALTAMIFGFAVLAWIGAIAFHASAPLPLLPQHEHAAHLIDARAEPGFGHWMTGWALMVIAMMLPPALPLVRAIDKLTLGRADRGALVGCVLGAFLATWTLAGMALYGAGTALRVALALLPPWINNASLLAGVAALAAGLFQFTSLKMACLDACRSPTSIIMTRWQAAAPRRAAARIGLAYGAICAGCCWALMLLCVLVGALMLPIMVITACLMLLERLLPSVRPLIPLQGGLAIAVGVLLIAGLLPPGFS